MRCDAMRCKAHLSDVPPFCFHQLDVPPFLACLRDVPPFFPSARRAALCRRGIAIKGTCRPFSACSVKGRHVAEMMKRPKMMN